MAVYKCEVVRMLKAEVEIEIDDDNIKDPNSMEEVKEYIKLDDDFCNEINDELESEVEKWDFEITGCKRIK